MLQLMAIARR